MDDRIKDSVEKSEMVGMICELQNSGKYINISACGGVMVRVYQFRNKDDCQTLQNGHPLFVGTMEEVRLYIAGYYRGMVGGF